MSQWWLLLSVTAAVALFGLLVATILHLVRMLRRALVASLPVQAEQRVAFPAPGTFVLYAETRHGAGELDRLGFALTRESDAVRIALSDPVVAPRIKVGSRVRYERARFTLAVPGTYVLHILGPIDGRAAATGRGAPAVVITRPMVAALVGHVLAMLALAFALIAAIVVSGLAVAGRVPSTTQPVARTAAEHAR